MENDSSQIRQIARGHVSIVAAAAAAVAVVARPPKDHRQTRDVDHVPPALVEATVRDWAGACCWAVPKASVLAVTLLEETRSARELQLAQDARGGG